MEEIESCIDVLKRVERELGEDSMLRIPIFTQRRLLESKLHLHQRMGTRISVTKELNISCVHCGVSQNNEEEYYLHLRKIHNISEADTTIESNRQRIAYDEDIATIRRLLTTYTEADLEDSFTTIPNCEG